MSERASWESKVPPSLLRSFRDKIESRKGKYRKKMATPFQSFSTLFQFTNSNSLNIELTPRQGGIVVEAWTEPGADSTCKIQLRPPLNYFPCGEHGVIITAQGGMSLQLQQSTPEEQRALIDALEQWLNSPAAPASNNPSTGSSDAELNDGDVGERLRVPSAASAGSSGSSLDPQRSSSDEQEHRSVSEASTPDLVSE